MAATVGDFLLKRLSEWGVKQVYGYPGDGINGIMGAFGRTEAVRFIQSRHEELAAFMACAHAKFSGEVGVCLEDAARGVVPDALAGVGVPVAHWQRGIGDGEPVGQSLLVPPPGPRIVDDAELGIRAGLAERFGEGVITGFVYRSVEPK